MNWKKKIAFGMACTDYRAVLRFFICLILTTLAALPTPPVFAATIDTKTRTILFSELRYYLDENTEDGIFTVSDDPALEPYGVKLKFLHPKLFRKDGIYMMCADFVASDGKTVLIDFFLQPYSQKEQRFRVLYYVTGRRSIFTKLFERLL